MDKPCHSQWLGRVPAGSHTGAWVWGRGGGEGRGWGEGTGLPRPLPVPTAPSCALRASPPACPPGTAQAACREALPDSDTQRTHPCLPGHSLHRGPWGEGWTRGHVLTHTLAHSHTRSLTRRLQAHVSKGEGRLSLRGERWAWVLPREASCLLLQGPATVNNYHHQVTAAARLGCTSPAQRSVGTGEVTDSPVAAWPRAPPSHATWCLMTTLSARDAQRRDCQGPIRGKIETLLFPNSLKQHKLPVPVIIVHEPSTAR